MAGRGYGKTRTGAEWVREQIENNGKRRIALVGRSAADVRDVMIEGESGLLNICPPWFRPEYEPSKRRLTWPNGAIATAYSASEPNLLRGPQHDGAWADELAAWRYEDAWDQLMFGLRLGVDPQCIVTTTPRPTSLIKRLAADALTYLTTGSTYENQENLAASFMRAITDRYKGTTLGRQELYAELLSEVAGALWKLATVERNRVKEAPAMSQIVVSVDPGTTDKKTSDPTGIVVCGVSSDRVGYVLEDRTAIDSPDGWARTALLLFDKYKANSIVAETNQGGEMVHSVIKTAAENLGIQYSYRGIHASRSKRTRAEPISAMYEQDRIKHVGSFPQLEDQMCTWIPGEPSPNNMDAMVHGMTAVMQSAPLLAGPGGSSSASMHNV